MRKVFSLSNIQAHSVLKNSEPIASETYEWSVERSDKKSYEH